MILIDETYQDVAVPFLIHSTIVRKKIGVKILSYLKNTSKPMSRILQAKTVIGAQPAPRIAAFSSRATGNMFNILSGTSMACAHVTGIANLGQICSSFLVSICHQIRLHDNCNNL
ncbi:hypothetical protein RYX36_032472 [Vicia faba]